MTGGAIRVLAVMITAAALAGCASGSPATVPTGTEPAPSPTATAIPTQPPPSPTPTTPPTATPVPPTHTATPLPTPTVVHIDLLAELCWIAYSPTHYNPAKIPVQYPSEEDVRQDLQVLRGAGFTGLVTYGANLQDSAKPGMLIDIPSLAQEAGFQGMIMGVWDPTSELELGEAERAGQNPIVIGYTVGNEGLDERYSLETLTAAMERLRRATGKPVTTTEQVHDYYRSSPLWKISDWIFPNAHPYFSNVKDPQEAVQWTEQIFTGLDKFTEKDLLFKEVGLPSGGDDGLSEANQARYYSFLRESPVQFVVFEAFDAPWKHLGRPDQNGQYPLPDPEPHWGVFTAARIAKAAAAEICPVKTE